jgi:3,4-dihydroxy 2-butanone 4-phosphate synthase/GTP cyclohydrolase II
MQQKSMVRFEMHCNGKSAFACLELGLIAFCYNLFISGITTGISATDRATTVRMLADPEVAPSDFARPGHIFPLRAREGGVLTRDGHTEAAVDLSILAGRGRVGLLCEIVSEEHPTEMARLPELKRFCKNHGLVLTSIVDIKQYRREVEEVADFE